MTLPAPEIELVRRSGRLDPIANRRLRAAVARGEWVRVTAGVYAEGTQWRRLRPIERHRLLVDEAARRRRSPVVLSHFAAAALHGIDILGSWPAAVDVTCARASGGRSSGAIRRRAIGLDEVDLEPYGRHSVTTPPQTALDLARVEPFVRGVAVVDQAIQLARAGGALSDVPTILALLARSSPNRGDRRAQRAIRFADAQAANVRESQSRVVIAALGFPAPLIQYRHVLRSGRVAHGDFVWPEHGHWGELDGRGKYVSLEFGADRDPADIVIDEKNRENEIRREFRGFSRWEPRDIDRPRRLYDILTSDGLPSALPRP